MAKFRFIIVDTSAGEVVGTDSEKAAKEFALNDENFVIDTGTETPQWLLDETNTQTIREQDTFTF